MLRTLLLGTSLVIGGCSSDRECRGSGAYAVSYVGFQQMGGTCLLASQNAATRALEATTTLAITVTDCLEASASRTYVDVQGCSISMEFSFEGHPDEGDWTSGGGYEVTATCGADACTYAGSVFPMFDSR